VLPLTIFYFHLLDPMEAAAGLDVIETQVLHLFHHANMGKNFPNAFEKRKVLH
jgi:hypothetical protein